MTINLLSQDNKQIKIINSDKTFANIKIHPDYWRLIGNVNFSHNNILMKCDSAYHFINENKINAFGNISINQGDSIVLTGKKLNYSGTKNIANILGNVNFKDNYMKLETDEISYNLNSKIASYPRLGNISDNNKIIMSKQGLYSSTDQKFIFKDSVIIIGSDYKIITDNMNYNSNTEISYFFGPSFIYSNDNTIYCENGWYDTKNDIAQFRENAYLINNKNNNIIKGDSLYYDKDNKYGRALNNVQLIDSIENISIYGDLAEYFGVNSEVIITKKPILNIYLLDDTLFMHATKFVSNEKSDSNNIIAYNNVKFLSKDFQGKCDSLSYSFIDSTIEMFKSPIIWSDKFQMTSDSISFTVNDGNINNMKLRQNPIIISEVDSINFNQIKGKVMSGHFINNKIDKMIVIGNGQSIFYVSNETKKDIIGLNYTESSDLTLYFVNNKLDKVNYNLIPISITTPYNDINENDRYLKGFELRYKERPNSKNDIFKN